MLVKHPNYFSLLLLGISMVVSANNSHGEPGSLTDSDMDQLVAEEDCKGLVKLRQTYSYLDNDTRPEFYQKIQTQERKLSCQSPRSRKRRGPETGGACDGGSVGDGFCDAACNDEAHQWDGGDCCAHTCAGGRKYSCGAGGFQCVGDQKMPVWYANFREHSQLCYRWSPDGDDGQCGQGEPRDLCAGINSLTQKYRDDTDGRSGGCRMSWGLTSTATQLPEWFNRVALCFKYRPDGDEGQCGGGAPKESCANLNSYTPEYRDDSDGRNGGCQMSWKLSLPVDADPWAQKLSVCFHWEADDPNGQCAEPGVDNQLCAPAGQWTREYRDDTDHRGGGCRMQWGIMAP